MPEIFISYRRDDSQAITDRIHEHLTRAFGEAQVFKDVDDIPIGADFRTVLQNKVHSCNVLLVIIGRHWSGITYDNGQRRLEDPNDFVRIEIEAGLMRDDLLVVPVMVNNAQMPAPDSLPESLRPMCYRNNIVVRNDPDFRNDIQRLIHRLQQVMGYKPKKRGAFSLPLPGVKLPTGFWIGMTFGIIVFIAMALILAPDANNGGNAPQTPENPVAQDVLETPVIIQNEYNSTIMDYLWQADNLSKFRQTVEHAGLDENLNDEEINLTIFAPSDDAFDAYLAATGYTFDDFLGQDEITLEHFVENHILDEDYDFQDLLNHMNDTFYTYYGSGIYIDSQEGNILLNGSATIEIANIDTRNGVLHIIDGVLSPQGDVMQQQQQGS